ncbi:HD-GYP domain-containing protein [[Empedobacter] haloabium]|uniref:HD-GYP domain-containing protein n=1 Tax=[Empedobacter] haloabium TaxID=592317 RepID=A0ABZ1UQ02_9BURK
MLKKITLAQARTGMYVHKIEGSWLNSPFWQSSFEIDSADVLATMRTTGIKALWIDTERGLDVAVPPAAPTAVAPAAAPPFAFARVERATTREEMARAGKVIARAKGAVMTMFNEARMGRLGDLTAATDLVDDVAASVMRNQGALINLVRLKQADDYTYLHSVAVCAMMIALARQLGLPDQEVRDCGMAGLLHDLGKVAIPPEILNKPGKLTDEEFQQVKRHPVAGFEALGGWQDVPDIARDVCLHHHERYDGKGYPHGLKGEQISRHARMGAVCDVYDAITSNRPYKEGWCPAESLRRMAEWTKEGHFDPVLFAAFVKCMGIYPVGTLLRLKSSRLGVVVDNSKSLLKPIVKVFFSARSMGYIQPEEVDLSLPGLTEAIATREEASAWGFGDISRYWANA